MFYYEELTLVLTYCNPFQTDLIKLSHLFLYEQRNRFIFLLYHIIHVIIEV